MKAVLLSLLVLVGAAAAQDLDYAVLEFAFSLECLEGQFYSWAATGHGLDPSIIGPGSPAPIGGQKANLSPAAQRYAHDIAKDEIAHVALLSSVLAGLNITAVCPQVDIGPAFEAAAAAAFGVPSLSPPFSPYTSDAAFYIGAFLFEDVGVTAYHGALRVIKDAGYATVAAGILGAEAYHAGSIRTKLIEIENVVTAYGVTVGQVITAASKLRASVGGGKDGDLSKLVPAPPNSVCYTRSVAQVLPIVYLGGAHSGGFFPNGLFGYFK